MTDSTICTRARVLATADNCRTVAPAHVIRAAIEQGYGCPAKPLTTALAGLRVAGCVMTADDWQDAVLAMLAGRYLYIGHGGRYMVDPSAAQVAA